jgi:hypothetical protein
VEKLKGQPVHTCSNLAKQKAADLAGLSKE